MPKTIEEIKQTLSKMENGNDLIEGIYQAIETEKLKGISESQKSNKEAQNLRKFKIAFEKLGYNPDENDLDTYIENITKTKEEAGKNKETKITLETLTKDFQSLRTNYEKTAGELAQERKLASELKEKNNRAKIKEILGTKMQHQIYGHDLIIDSFIANGSVGLDNDTVVFLKGEDKIDMDTGIKNFIESRPDIVKLNQKGGADSAAGDHKQAGAVDENAARLAILRKMNRPVY